ncbi:MAG TPA: DMT family transporter [Hyphomonadaceae bacterium]|nr:DMT family transporter [Hyphomonadaceae bacterium]HPN06740.1 DMT family transporter [Hyphomonadaceae bacterium]
MDPTVLALALGLGSAVTLAGANTFVKAAKDILGGRAVMAFTSAILMLPFVFVAPPPNTQTWMILGLSLPAHWLYQTALVRALSRGDLSLVFPVMRGSAPLLTAIAASLVLGEHLSPLAIAGLLIASLATIVFALPEKNFGGSRRVRNSALLWALATGACVAIYNVIDAQGVRAGPSQWSFIVWLFVLDWIGINVIAYVTRGHHKFVAAARTALWPGIGAGICSLISFSMALYGFSIAPVAYISAMRETAVVAAAVMGWWFLKEGFGLRRTLAAVVLAAGLTILQFG